MISEWLIGWSIVFIIAWLVDWLIDWLRDHWLIDVLFVVVLGWLVLVYRLLACWHSSSLECLIDCLMVCWIDGFLLAWPLLAWVFDCLFVWLAWCVALLINVVSIVLSSWCIAWWLPICFLMIDCLMSCLMACLTYLLVCGFDWLLMFLSND